MKAYWFFNDTLRDGRPVPPDGAWLEHDGPLVLCRSGLHASTHPLDALKYAPGPMLAQVTLDGEIVRGRDKIVAQRRRIDKRIDTTDLLRTFAQDEALRVLHYWDNISDKARQYLKTGQGQEEFCMALSPLRSVEYAVNAAINALCAERWNIARYAWQTAEGAARAQGTKRNQYRRGQRRRFAARVARAFEENP